MKKREKAKKKKAGEIVMILAFLLLGFICGVVITGYLERVFSGGLSPAKLLNMVLALAGMYAAIYAQILIHEAGHLVAGLLSGYKFSSFRVGSLMWLRAGDGIKLRRLSLSGTGGQCLMSPPDMSGGKMPFVLYNLGGVLMNLVSVLVCALLFLLFDGVPFLSLFLLMMCIIGLGFALINGIPMSSSAVSNDGRNALELGRSPEALRSLWVQMKVSEENVKGTRLRDMPEAWFYIPDDEAMKNGMIAAMAVFYENRLMDRHEFAPAQELADRLLNSGAGLAGIHRSLLVCDRIYCELIGGGDRALIERLHGKELQKFMKQMGKFPSVIRTQHAYALLFERDEKKAERLRKHFEKVAKSYPYPADLESERELMDIAETIQTEKAVV